MLSADDCVKVRREDLARALRAVSAAEGLLILRAGSGTAVLSRGAMREELTADGSGEFAAQFEMDPAYYARRIPAGEWLEIAFDGSHLAFGPYRHPATPAGDNDTLAIASQKEMARRVARAAKVLESYFVVEADLQQLCQPDSRYTEDERPMIEKIAKAWVELAPYGVSPDALKKLITHRIRNAWDRPLKPVVKKDWFEKKAD